MWKPRDGFEALAVLCGWQPEVLISDPKMPNMSGFELLAIVRKRFPGIGVVAHSGEFSPISVPEGVLADRFLSKDANSPLELVEMVRELVAQSPLQPQEAKVEAAPAWLPRSATGYLVITCPMCLRSFSVSTHNIEVGVLRKDSCVHCGAEVSYRIEQALRRGCVSASKTPNSPHRFCIAYP